MEKLVANAANSLPDSRSLHKVVVEMSTFLKWWIGVHIRLKQTLIRYAMPYPHSYLKLTISICLGYASCRLDI
jgi:hypothetical protein